MGKFFLQKNGRSYVNLLKVRPYRLAVVCTMLMYAAFVGIGLYAGTGEDVGKRE